MASSKTSAGVAAAATCAVAFAGYSAFVAPVAHDTSQLQERTFVSEAQLAGGSVPSAPGSSAGALPLALGAVAATGLLAARRASGGAARASRSDRHVLSLAAFENELGVQDPVGFWDPLGYTSAGDLAAFKRRRSVELKHGRISMLATMGYITPEITGKFPGYLSNSMNLKFADVPTGLAAISKVPALGWAQIVAYGGFCELSAGSDDWKTGTPGDYGFKVLTSSDPAEKNKKLSAELANGRLAMMAIIGMFFQDGLTGSAWGPWALYEASPLRAFENELGVQSPLGFWDPAGWTEDGSIENYKRRRQTEIKHGRIAMLATMGYITPELYGKLPGYLSPSLGIKFADVPNGLGAISKVPAAGWGQIIAYMAFCEVSSKQGPGTPGAAGDFGWKVLTSSDPAVVKKKLASELANGRLAMIAIIGMFFQEGITGDIWGGLAKTAKIF